MQRVGAQRVDADCSLPSASWETLTRQEPKASRSGFPGSRVGITDGGKRRPPAGGHTSWSSTRTGTACVPGWQARRPRPGRSGGRERAKVRAEAGPLTRLDRHVGRLARSRPRWSPRCRPRNAQRTQAKGTLRKVVVDRHAPQSPTGAVAPRTTLGGGSPGSPTPPPLRVPPPARWPRRLSLPGRTEVDCLYGPARPLARPGDLDPIETASRDELAALQLDRLRTSLRRAYENVPLYRRPSTTAGVHPDDCRALADLARFPFTTKADLRDNYPFGMFAVPREQVVADARLQRDDRPAHRRRLHRARTSTPGPT